PGRRDGPVTGAVKGPALGTEASPVVEAGGPDRFGARWPGERSDDPLRLFRVDRVAAPPAATPRAIVQQVVKVGRAVFGEGGPPGSLPRHPLGRERLWRDYLDGRRGPAADHARRSKEHPPSPAKPRSPNNELSCPRRQWDLHPARNQTAAAGRLQRRDTLM